MIRFVTFGETLVQYNAAYIGPFDEHGTYDWHCAGAESNVAVNLEKLGVADVETVWVSRLGGDEQGEFILRELNGKTRVAAKMHKGERTAVFYLNHLEDGRPARRYRRAGSAASRLSFQDVEPHLADADLLNVTGITPVLSDRCRQTVAEALAYARDNDIPVCFDANYREQLWSPRDARPVFEEMLGYSSLFKVGHDEAEIIWGRGCGAEEYATYFQRVNRGLVVVTRGPEGAVAFDGASLVSHPGYAVEMVDPVGAGDAFLAGFLGGISARHALKEFLGLDESLRRQVLEESLVIANVCGALTCTRRGDTVAMPTIQEVREFIESGEPAD